jgi:hypothetical protein
MTTEIKPVLNPNLDMRYGIWTGPGYSAGVPSKAFVPLTKAEMDRDGYDDFDRFVSKPHDIAYNDAQWDFIVAITNKTKSKVEALIDYYNAISAADRKFIADAEIYHADTTWGETARIDGITAFGTKIKIQDAEVLRLQTAIPNNVVKPKAYTTPRTNPARSNLFGSPIFLRSAAFSSPTAFTR